jgi:hypothetical protein
MSPEPRFYARVLVGRVVVHDDMQIEFGRSLGIDLIEETDELLMAMARHAVADHFAIEHAECRKQGSRAVALVVVGHRSAASLLHRETGLGAIEGLDLTFLVDTQHDRPVRRIEIEPDNIVELRDKLFVPTDLEGLDEMRLETVQVPYALNGHSTDALRFGHGPRTPVGGGMGCCVQCGLDDCLHFSFGDGWDAPGTGSVFCQPAQSKGQKTLPPELDGRPRHFQISRDVQARHSVRRHLDDSGPLDQSEREASSVRPGVERGSLLGRQNDWGHGYHAENVALVEGCCQVIYGTLH